MIWNLHGNISNNKQDEEEQDISTASAVFVFVFGICLGFTKSTAAILVLGNWNFTGSEWKEWMWQCLCNFVLQSW